MSATRSTTSAVPPSTADLLFPDFAGEHATTRRFLERFPEGHADWRPHERSRTLAELATHIAEIPNRGVAIATTDDWDVAAHPLVRPLTTAKALVAHHDAAVAALHAALAPVTVDALSADWTLRRGPIVFVSGQKRVLMRSVMMSHLIHHRAQLGVYYRLLGLPVPSAYGPTADDAPPPRS